MGDIVIECRNLGKAFGAVRAVDQVSLTFEAGKVTALVGPNGAGKTSLFHLLCGAQKPDQGEILYRGQLINGLPTWRIARAGIGRLFQDVRVFSQLTVLENVLVAFPRQIGESPFWSLMRRPQVNAQERALQIEAERLLTLTSLQDHLQIKAEALSYGQQKLLALARLLAAEADVLLLDEPTAGVNPVMVRALLDLIRKLAKEGKTVVVIEHNMNVVLEIANWLFFMDEGQLVAFGLPEEVLADRVVRTTYLGL